TTFETIDPRAGEVIARISEGAKEDIDIAVKAAREAFDSGPWPRMSGVERAKIMMKFAELVDENTEELAALDAIDAGKLYYIAKVIEIPSAANTLRYYAGAADKIHGECPRFGVVISTLNFHRLNGSECFLKAGIPNGVLNVVPGFGPTAGAAISSHMDIDVAKHLLLDLCLANTLFLNLWFFQGEVCVASSRVFVQEGIYDQVEKKLVEKAKAWIVGDPFDPKTQQGPQADRNQFEKIISYIEHGKKEGATLLTGGKAVGSHGYYIEPTIFSDVKEDMLIAKDEIFGPVMALMKFKTIEEAIKSANNTRYGLAAGIVTKNLDIANTVSRSIRAGVIWINSYLALGSDIPFGGYKMSGFGRDLGLEALHKYLQVKSVVTPIYNSPWL
ncbi:hypothetical protein RYX36_033275, partial [Vicia faba]